MTEFVQVKKRKRGSLRFRRAGNPDRELLRLELVDLRWRRFRQLILFKIDIFRLQTCFAHLETTPTSVSKKPETIAWRFTVGCELGRFAQSCVKNFLRFRRISQHQKTKAIELEQILFCFFGHRTSFRRQCYAPRLDRNEIVAATLSRGVRAGLALARGETAPRLQLLEASCDFLRVLATVECGDANVTFALRAESRAGRDDHIHLVQHSVEHLPAR